MASLVGCGSARCRDPWHTSVPSSPIKKEAAWAKWQYCKIIEPTKMMGRPAESARLPYLGRDKASETIEEIDTPEHALARLGAEGWELVDHSQLWSTVEGSGVLPIMEVFYLKREG